MVSELLQGGGWKAHNKPSYIKQEEALPLHGRTEWGVYPKLCSNTGTAAAAAVADSGVEGVTNLGWCSRFAIGRCRRPLVAPETVVVPHWR